MKTEYILMRADTLQVLIPRSQLTHVGHLDDRSFVVENTARDAAELSAHLAQGQSCYVTLSSDLAILPTLPVDRFVEITMDVATTVRWCWTEVRVLSEPFQSTPLHQLMMSPTSPLHHVATLKNGSHAFICSSQSLLRHVFNLLPQPVT